jgi:hypothetical protein
MLARSKEQAVRRRGMLQEKPSLPNTNVPSKLKAMLLR